MNYREQFSKTTLEALKNEPPGSWIPNIPPTCIRLNAGYPAPNLVPTQGIVSAMHQEASREADKPFQYLGSRAATELHKWLTARMKERGMPMEHDHLLVTAGAIQAIDLVARILLDDESVVAVEAPTYMEALEVFRNYTNHLLSVPVDSQGMQVEKFGEMLADRKRAGLPLPKLVYTIPTFQNPTGTTLSETRRRNLLELAVEYNFLILEDDAYGELGFSSTPPTLKSLDVTGCVLYVGSLSKVVAPGIRIGWLAAHPELVRVVDWFKKDLTHPLMEATVSTFLHGIDWSTWLRELHRAYRDRRDVMIKALDAYMPQGVTWTVPDGGYFVWIRIPGVNTSGLLNEAMTEGVAFIPGQHFFADESKGTEFLRLSFSYVNISDLDRGVKTLSDMLWGHQVQT